MRTKTITIILTLVAILSSILLFPTNPYFYTYMPRNVMLLISGVLLVIFMLINYKHIKIDYKDTLVLIFLVLLFLSTCFSSNIYISLYGAPTRFEGFLIFVVYACIYFASKKFFKYEKITKFLNIMFYICLIIGILGIIQTYIHTNQFDPFFSRGVSATFVNSNFFGSFISIVLPISMTLFILSGNKKSFILSNIMFFNMISSGTRSTWLAFACICLLGLIYLIKQKDKNYWKHGLIIILCFVVIFSFLISPSGSSFTTSKIAKLRNDLELFSENGLSNNLGSGRMEIWNMTLKVIVQAPILGCGTDNLERGFAKYCLSDLLYYADKHHYSVDKAHNEYLHIAATNGIPALIIYLVFLGLILIPKLKLIFKDKLALIFSICIISYLVQAFFNISTIGVAPLFWMILGLSDNEFIKSEKCEVVGK